MSNVTLRIGGRDYTMACAEGEEDHVSSLGRLIDSKLQTLAGNAGMSETRQLLFAALLLADELHEVGSQPAAAPSEPAFDPARLEALAEKLESCAASLED
jgi:cell division protein ZapA